MRWSRIECDLAHVSLPKVLAASNPWKRVPPKACGDDSQAGTNLALLKSMESIQDRIHSCVMATCCHGQPAAMVCATRSNMSDGTAFKNSLRRILFVLVPTISKSCDNGLTMNSTGIYKIKVGKKHFLYINPQKGVSPPQQPVIDKKFWSTVKETETQFVRSLRRFDVNLTVPPDVQRRRLAVEAPQEEEEEVEVVEDYNNNQDEDDENQFSHEPFWSSNDARKLFGALPTNRDASVTLRRKIATLKVINHQKKDGYKLVIDGGDPLDECTAADVSRLKERSLILLLAYKTCLKRMGGNNASFASCIQEVLEMFEGTGINQATHWETVRIWNRSFRRRELWPHPRGPPAARNRSDPPLFEVYPEGKKGVIAWCHENMRGLSLIVVLPSTGTSSTSCTFLTIAVVTIASLLVHSTLRPSMLVMEAARQSWTPA